MADDSIGLWNPVVKGYTGRRWSAVLVQDSLPVDTTGWDVIAMARSDLDDATAALELSVSNSRVTVGGGVDNNTIVFTVVIVPVQSGLEAVHVVWAEAVVLDVLLAGPHHLHRPGDLPADGHGALDHVGFQAAPETAAHQEVVQRHRFDRHAGGLGGGGAGGLRRLGSQPDLAAPIGHVDGAVQRLHGRVGEIGLLVDRLDPLCSRRHRRRRIARVASLGALGFDRLMQARHELVLIEVGVVAGAQFRVGRG